MKHTPVLRIPYCPDWVKLTLMLGGAGLNLVALFSSGTGALVAVGCALIAIGAALGSRPAP